MGGDVRVTQAYTGPSAEELRRQKKVDEELRKRAGIERQQSGTRGATINPGVTGVSADQTVGNTLIVGR